MSEQKMIDPNQDLESKINVLVAGVPQIDELEKIAQKTQEQFQEYGVSTYFTNDGEKYSLFMKSDGLTIFHPTIPSELQGKVKLGVFIHCHPIKSSEESNDGKTLHILPSGHGAFRGDFGATLMSCIVGDYLNIASKYGLTINIGVEGISREEDLTRTLRDRVGSHHLANEHVWKIISGDQGGTSFNQEEFPQAVNDKFVINEEVVFFSHTEKSLGTKYFLHLSWDTLKKLESEFGGVDNLFFGNGLDQLVKHLKLNIHHEKNMAMATKNKFAPPVSRGSK